MPAAPENSCHPPLEKDDGIFSLRTIYQRDHSGRPCERRENVLNSSTEESEILDGMLRDLGAVAEGGHKIKSIAMGNRSWPGANGGLHLLPLAPPHYWLVRFLIGPSQKLAEELTAEPSVEIELDFVIGVRRMTLPIIDPLFQRVKHGEDLLFGVSFVVEIPDMEFPNVSIRDAS